MENYKSCLPMMANSLVPHEKPMQVISRLLKANEIYGEVEAIVDGNSIFVDKDGSVEDVILLEMMAQSAAAVTGFQNYSSNKQHKGLLVGAKDIIIEGRVYIKTPVLIQMTKKAQFSRFQIFNAVIKTKDKKIAQGEIKVFKE